MTTEQFNSIFRDTIEKAFNLLNGKAAEYAESGDRLHNFKRAAELQGCTPIGALGGMMVKHTVSIYDLIRRYERGANIPPELWDEKIIDSINYLILLRAAVKEIAGDKQGASAVVLAEQRNRA